MTQPRRLARRLAMMSVCSQIVNPEKTPQEALDDVLAVLNEPEEDCTVLDPIADHIDEMARAICNAYANNKGVLETKIGIFLDRSKNDVSLIEQAVIMTALAEHRTSLNTPTNVLINEYIELTKEYGAEGGYRLVNGVLDSIFKDEADNVDNAPES